MNPALIVLIWLVAIGVGLWILSAIVGAILAVLVLKKVNKEFKDFDDNFPSFKNRRF